MAHKSTRVSSSGGSLSRIKNKVKRQELFVQYKKVNENTRRDDRLKRKRLEAKHPALREERLRKNIPSTIDSKRQWDNAPSNLGDGLGLSVDIGSLKRKRNDNEDDPAVVIEPAGSENEDQDSMLDSESEGEATTLEYQVSEPQEVATPQEDIQGQDVATADESNETLDALKASYPTIFNPKLGRAPKVLLTTSLNSTLHKEAEFFQDLLPNSVYVPRSSHRYGHKFSVREIASFASNRRFSTLVVIKEDQKRPTGLTMIHLPNGPTFHFSISNWMEGKKLPGHGNATEHDPELILNNFRTPLGLLTAHFFRTIFPPQPQLAGRQVVTLHNQRDYIFVRRHRYVFRDKRDTEKSIVGSDGKVVEGVEEIRAGLQELGPRFTLKLRRLDSGIGRGTQNGGVQWEWKGRTDKIRTKFQL